MKKKILLPVIAVIILICGVLINKAFIGEKPFKDLTASDISSVTAELYPPDMKFAVNDDEIKKLVDILNKVVVYNPDDSYTERGGQAVIFNIIKTDGTQLNINAYGSFIIIDGVGYKTKHEQCEELSRLGNNLRSSKEG